MSITQKYKDKDGESAEGESSEEESSAREGESEGQESNLTTRPMGIGARRADEAIEKVEASAEESEEDDEEEEEGGVPAQLGTKRFVYAAYFGGGIGIAFLVSKFLSLAWFKLSQYKPVVGEPNEELVMVIAAFTGIGAAIYYWYRTRARELAEEVADELSKVTWPSKQEVTNSTAVVLVTTALAVVFFALMDRFWGFVTNLVYGS